MFMAGRAVNISILHVFFGFVISSGNHLPYTLMEILVIDLNCWDVVSSSLSFFQHALNTLWCMLVLFVLFLLFYSKLKVVDSLLRGTKIRISLSLFVSYFFSLSDLLRSLHPASLFFSLNHEKARITCSRDLLEENSSTPSESASVDDDVGQVYSTALNNQILIACGDNGDELFGDTHLIDTSFIVP